MRWNAQASIPSLPRYRSIGPRARSVTVRPRRQAGGGAVERAARRSMIASAKAAVPGRAAQVVGRVRALGDDRARRAVSTRSAAAGSPRCRSISAPDRISAVGFALSWPGVLGRGAVDGLEHRRLRPDVGAGRHAEAADQPGAQVADDVAVQVRQHQHVVQLRLLDQLHAHVVDDAVLELDPARRSPRRPCRQLSRNSPSDSFMMLALCTAVTLRRPLATA